MITKTLRSPLRVSLRETPRPGSRLRLIATSGRMAVFIALTCSLHAQDEKKWVGKWVVQKAANFQLKMGDRSSEGVQGILYQVRKANGPSLLLTAGATGWATAESVVPVEEAFEFFTEHIQADPDDAFGYAMCAALGIDPKSQPEKAMADCDKALVLNPASASGHFIRGNIFKHQKEYDQAIAAYAEAIRLKPQFAEAFNLRAVAWHAKKNFDQAFADYNEAIRIEPASAKYVSNRGAVAV